MAKNSSKRRESLGVHRFHLSSIDTRRLLVRFGSRSRIDRLVLGLLNPQTLAEARDAKRNDILTYFAMLQLRGVRPPPIRLLPPETQADIKLLWPSYKSAMEEGQQFLFQAW